MQELANSVIDGYKHSTNCNKYCVQLSLLTLEAMEEEDQKEIDCVLNDLLDCWEHFIKVGWVDTGQISNLFLALETMVPKNDRSSCQHLFLSGLQTFQSTCLLGAEFSEEEEDVEKT